MSFFFSFLSEEEEVAVGVVRVIAVGVVVEGPLGASEKEQVTDPPPPKKRKKRWRSALGVRGREDEKVG